MKINFGVLFTATVLAGLLFILSAKSESEDLPQVKSEIEIAGSDGGSSCPAESWQVAIWYPPGLLGGGSQFYDCCGIMRKGEAARMCS